MKIILDVMGFENKIECAIFAAQKFVKDFPQVKIILSGDYTKIQPFLKQQDDFEFINTSEYIKMDDTPIIGLRKQNSSLALGLKKLSLKQADAIVSGGSTSCFAPLVYSLIKLIPCTNKFGFLANIFLDENNSFYMIDCGANIYPDANDLYNFALMANTYVKLTKKIANPKIGILNIGTENHKGLKYHKIINEMLMNNKQLNYIGFIEPKNLLIEHCVDVLITDGYSGNILLKTLEGSLKAMSKLLKKEYFKYRNFFAYLFSLGILRKIKKYFNYKNKAAAIVLGTDGVIIKTHGSVDETQFYFALKTAYENVNNNILNELRKIKNE